MACLALALVYGAALGNAGTASAQVAPVGDRSRLLSSASDWGGIGLLQTRTARFAPDGAFEVGYSFVDPFKRYYISNTFFPWLEGTFRYTEIRNKLYSDVPEFSHDQRYKDRGADIKLRLLSEGNLVPAVAIGFQDLLGTGIFAGEYVVASKQWLDFDFSVGLGWGSIGSGGGLPNPLRLGRRPGEVGAGGQLSVKDFFRGDEVGLFGGIEYRTPLQGLTLKVEYDANSYDATKLNYPKASPYNYGVVFRPYPYLEFSLGRERGNTTMLRFSLRTDLHGQGVPKLDPPPPALTPRPTMQAIEAVAPPPARPFEGVMRALGVETQQVVAPREPTAAETADAVFDTLLGRGFDLQSFSISSGVATVGVTRAVASAQTLSATAAAVLDRMPGDVTGVTLVEFSRGLEVARGNAARPGTGLVGAGDPLTLVMAGLGLAVEQVDASATTVTMHVRAFENQAADLSGAVRAARPFLPPAVTITAIDERTGRSETWLTGLSPDQVPARPEPQPVLPPRIAATTVAAQQVEDTVGFTEDQRLTVARQLQTALISEGIVLETVGLDGNHALVAVSAHRYRQAARNEGLAARIVVNNLPAEIEEVTIAFLNGGIEMSRLSFRRTDFERALTYGGSPDELLARMELEPGQPGYEGGWVPGRYPRFSWSLSPQLRQHIGGPDRFYLFQAWLSASAGIDLFRGVSITSQFGKNVYNNFKLLTLESDSVMPKVRSDIKHYLQDGADGNIVRLQTNYLAKPAEDVYFRVSAGLLEEMYGGVSTEVLFRPFESRLALGAELNWVQQRDFDQRFKFRDYQVVTGHVSLYYDTPYQDVRIATHVGRYLAGDVGATFEVSRRFDSGVRIGAWATFTNVPPDVFGEGSFDKGFFIVIPFDVFTVGSTRASGTFGFRPLTRDGGQRLVLTHRLYDLTSPASLGEVTRDFDRFLLQ